MRKAFHRSASITEKVFFLFLVHGLVGGGGFVRPAMASSELDRQFALETVGYLKSSDNVDGLFADYVSAGYKEYFAHQSRFVLQDLSKADTALTKSKIPYHKLIDDPAVLSQVARSTRSESIIRTKITKEGAQYRFNLEWLHSPGMETMATETFNLNEPSDGKSFGLGDVRESLEKALDRMILKVPFLGSVTGRDNNSVTVNIGALANLKTGDTLVLATLDEVKKHPLLKAIVDWRFTRTGKIELDNVDERIAFGKVTEEDPGRQVGRYQKVIQIIPRPEIEKTPIESTEAEKEEPPRLGWVAVGPWVGNFGRQVTTAITNTGRSGGGFLFGAKAEAQLWLNRSWFFESGYQFGSWSYSQKNIQTGTESALSSASGTVRSFRAELGYSYLITHNFFGPRGWAKLGYRSTSFTLPLIPSELLSPISLGSVYFGLGGDLPVTSEWGALLGMTFGLFTSGSDSSSTATVNSASDLSFFFGGYYRFNPKMSLRVGIDIMAQGADYSDQSSLSQKIFTLAPALLFYF